MAGRKNVSRRNLQKNNPKMKNRVFGTNNRVIQNLFFAGTWGIMAEFAEPAIIQMIRALYHSVQDLRPRTIR